MNVTSLQTIPSLLLRCRRKYGNKPAMHLTNGHYLSYADMLWSMSRTEHVLRTQGVSQGSKVALFVENTPQALETFFAVLNMGAIAIPLRCDLSADNVASVLATEKPAAIFVGKDTLSLVPSDMTLSVINIDTNAVIRDCGALTSLFGVNVKEEDPAVIVYQENSFGSLRRRVYTHKEMSREAVVIKRPVKVSAMPFDTLVDYSRSFIMPVLNGVCIYCRDILHSLSAMQMHVAHR